MIFGDPTLFRSAKLKIKRADHHFTQLVGIQNTFPQTGLYSVHTEGDAETTGQTLTFQVKDETLNKIPLTVGDFIHNLHTALDHVAYELVTRFNSGPTPSANFPFGKTREEAVTTCQGVIQGVPLDIITCILECIQPYRGGNGEALCVLHALDIRDKHHVFIPHIGVSWLTVITKSREEEITHFISERGDKPNVIRTPPGTEIKDYRNPSLQILFDEVEGLKGESVFPVLSSLRHAVVTAVHEIERAYLLVANG